VAACVPLFAISIHAKVLWSFGPLQHVIASRQPSAASCCILSSGPDFGIDFQLVIGSAVV
jgi:hypothetical protein